MTRLHLIRHGPTHARAMVGWTDLPADLSDTAALARLTAELPAAAPVISSDLSRAVTTADAIQHDRPRLPHDPRLREINFGGWEMRGFAEVEAEEPRRIRAFWETPGEISPPGGESWNALRARADAAIDALIARHPGGDLVVVAHFGLILSQIQRARGIGAAEAFGQKIDNLSLTELSHGPGGWSLGRINHRP
ncbi:histidine phosphatase family protein [Pseudodonghicola flavimaris]|uniref:Histidine phosphatase family protein n=1 Tax=Pseudodonghicola flavimaris TaxID=3050036 RepID=A0ABT7F4P5_9RHOB|nr:histidine phosphatase family protein [Pseudodonghicola flavimaris]MDK3019583.1 histidine phosphatase family protein [Pseudodonghicola flavimaris]